MDIPHPRRPARNYSASSRSRSAATSSSIGTRTCDRAHDTRYLQWRADDPPLTTPAHDPPLTTPAHLNLTYS